MTMGGYVTDTRRLYDERKMNPDYSVVFETPSGVKTRYYCYPVPESVHNYRWRIPEQVTTSYRSRGEELEDLLAEHTGSWASASRLIRNNTRLMETDYDNGHEFDTLKQEYFPLTRGTVRTTTGYSYSGSLSPSHSSVSRMWPTVQPDQASLRDLGQEGINRTLPTNSPADLAQALVELKREGLPALIGAQTLRGRGPTPSGIGSEHLNYQFGIKPLIRDVQRTLQAMQNSSEILHKYQEESGEKLHRQYTFPTSKSITEYEAYGVESASRFPLDTRSGYNSSGYGTYTQIDEITVSSWFHGCYSYYLQRDNQTLNRLHELANQTEYLLGLELTPELLWEVSPWSWLADWIGNIGINISNATALAQDGLVLRYGYIMRTTVHKRFRTVSNLQPRVEGNPLSMSDVFVTTRKQRLRATPYGFGLNPDTFSVRQWSILGALGLTRGNRSLRYNE